MSACVYHSNHSNTALASDSLEDDNAADDDDDTNEDEEDLSWHIHWLGGYIFGGHLQVSYIDHLILCHISIYDLWLCWNLLFQLPQLLLYLSDSHSCIRPFPLMLIPWIPSLSTTSLCCRVSHCRLLFDALLDLVRHLSHQSRSFASFPFFHRPVAVPVSDSLHFIWHMKKAGTQATLLNHILSLHAWHLCRVLRLWWL